MTDSLKPDLLAPEIFVFRTDASLQIGSGHVMRCLTLAEALRKQGARCHFICREHPGNMIEQIIKHGFDVTTLSAGYENFQPAAQTGILLPVHASWLGTSWQADAEAVRSILISLSPNWLVVDHYALDHHWEEILRPHCNKIMVIDDLADRSHDCDLLLDQNLGHQASDYLTLVPASCTMLIGPDYALLRSEFETIREYSLKRREQPKIKKLLISMGGMDLQNSTSEVLRALRYSTLPSDCHIIVVIGSHSPSLEQVNELAKHMPWTCEVKVNVHNMARLMADSDLAIGAAGGTSWERCALGLPSLITAIAENQRTGMAALSDAHAAIVLGDVITLKTSLPKQIATMDSKKLIRLSKAASAVVDGHGTARITIFLLDGNCRVRPMCKMDLENVLQWRNHPDIRHSMYTQHVISHDEHEAWYEQAKNDRGRHLLIVEDQHNPIGFVQFTDRNNGVAEWGFYAVPGMPKGSGLKLGNSALNYAFHNLGFHTVYGKVVAFNKRSIAFHRRFGFHEKVLLDNFSDGKRKYNIYLFTLSTDKWRIQRGSIK